MIVRHVETLFCDDIRHEMNGKVTFIGVYGGGLFVPAFPATLPKLCLSIKIVTPEYEPIRSLTLRVLKDEDVLQEVVVDEAQLAAASDSPEDEQEVDQEDHNGRVHVAPFMLVFSPMVFDHPCTLRVRVRAEGGELSGLALQVNQGGPYFDASAGQTE